MRLVLGAPTTSNVIKEDPVGLPARRQSEFASPYRLQSLQFGKEIVSMEAMALRDISENLGDDFLDAVDAIHNLHGCLLVSGMGKAGLIGAKLAATFASTGTPSHFLHAAEAIHGDLGRIRASDIVLMLSQSGETDEVTRILPTIKQQAKMLIAITSRSDSTLGRSADIVLLIPKHEEACALGLAPSTSTTSMLAIGDALALVVSRLRGFTSNDFARFHPGGSLGKKLAKVDDAMRTIEECRVAPSSLSIRQILVQVAKRGRRTGAIMLVDKDGCLNGIFTDSDLARLLEQRSDAQLDLPAESIMTKRFQAIQSGARLEDAIFVLAHRKISELPVIDDDNCPLGMIDITDVLGLVQAKPSLRGTNSDEAPTTIRLFQG